MDVPAAAAGPWIVLGAVLGALLLLAARSPRSLRLRSPAPPEPAAAPPADGPRDDLADFLAHPPGTRGAPVDDARRVGAARAAGPPRGPRTAPGGDGPGGALAGPRGRRAAARRHRRRARRRASGRRRRGAGASPHRRAPHRRAPHRRAPHRRRAPRGRRRAAGLRRRRPGGARGGHHRGATPSWSSAWTARGGEVARLRLPAVNCLAVAAPPEPGDPACRAARTEYAELSAPAPARGARRRPAHRLRPLRHLLRPPGAAAEPTGRSYEVVVTVTAAGAEGRGLADGGGRAALGRPAHRHP